MAEDFRVFEVGNGGVLVLLHPGAAISREDVVELLVAAGIDRAVIVVVEPREAGDAEVDGRCVVVPVDANVSEDPEVTEAARLCAQSASGVVVVLGEGFDYPGLHPIAKGYGTQCGWSPTELRSCLEQGEGSVPPLTDSAGSAVDRPRPSQVNCR